VALGARALVELGAVRGRRLRRGGARGQQRQQQRAPARPCHPTGCHLSHVLFLSCDVALEGGDYTGLFDAPQRGR
jgi:hypothetical protein